MRSLTILIGLIAMLLSCTVSADSIDIEPGRWEMTTTMTMSIMPQPQVTTTVECIEEDKLSPEDFNMDEENPCSISDVTADGDTVSWSINCPMEGGAVMDGQWEITSGGDTLTGTGEMSAEIAGQQMGFNMSWEGKRTGECK